ncbi:M20 metallopeptidase family protein [Rubricoccus marinus]|uniref:N-acyl-L-amino acid amidohydrolase n=1 Tax=Rubricoccus marinus TaxID=716817 RepID=A0A259TZP3_9BACT|nr:M20 family metallopeptidase [Rubricoccus marinus]OZC03201.1 N-acyl-L-amino acid amidohydrolase [Rubricoccus marinus]
MLDRIRSLTDSGHADVVRLRRQIHRAPELAFEEHETAALIAQTLREIGLEPTTGVGKTGVVAHIEGAQPGPVRALRADIDALPIREANTFSFASQNEGKMHACGHDGHTAMLLGVARVLHALREDLAGTVRLVFQPSEEKAPGGAKIMIEEGVLDEMDGVGAPEAILGQHVVPHLDSGVIGVRGGAFMASADEIYLTVHGQGGHAAAPHLLVDPVMAQAHILTALQTVISRHRPPGVPSLLSFGRVEADGATNIVPDDVRLIGTFRSMDEDWRWEAHRLIRRVAEHTALALGATCEVEIVVGYPSLVNDERLASGVAALAREFLGAERVVEVPEWYAAEDFAWYTREVPGCFYVLGTGSDEADSRHGLHTPRFTLDEEAMRTGVGLMAALAMRGV